MTCGKKKWHYSVAMHEINKYGGRGKKEEVSRDVHTDMTVSMSSHRSEVLPEDVHEEAPDSGRHAEEGADPQQTLAGLQHVDEPPQTPPQNKFRAPPGNP